MASCRSTAPGSPATPARRSITPSIKIAREIIAEATATDEVEDELYGRERGDELPEQLRTPEGWRGFFRQAKRERERENEDCGATETEPEVPLLEAKNTVGRGRQGRDAWLREGKRQLEQHRWENPDSIPRGRPARLLLAAERLDSDHDVECRSNGAYELYRATARDRLGRRPAAGQSRIGSRSCRPAR